MENFKHVGYWWNDSNIELVEIDGEVYALSGWNGEAYLNAWKCAGEYHMDASEEEYRITPIYNGGLELVGYEVI